MFPQFEAWQILVPNRIRVCTAHLLYFIVSRAECRSNMFEAANTDECEVLWMSREHVLMGEDYWTQQRMVCDWKMISNRCSTVQLAAILSVFERVSAFVQTRYKSLISQFLVSNISECRTLVGVFWWLCIHHWNWQRRRSRHRSHCIRSRLRDQWGHSRRQGIQQRLPRCLPAAIGKTSLLRQSFRRCYEMLDVVITEYNWPQFKMTEKNYGKKDVHAKQAFWRIP